MELAALGLYVNANNGYYKHGKSYSVEKKKEIADAYKQLLQAHGTAPSIRCLAKHCKVSKYFAQKVIKELQVHGSVIDPNKVFQGRVIGAGVISLTTEDEVILLKLYLEEPARSIKSYVGGLYYFTGKQVSKSTISNFWLKAFPVAGSLRKTNTVPYSKFSDHNIERACEYLNDIADINPVRLKFGDEKLLKGSEVYNRVPRRNVLNGEVPPTFTGNDYRNTYAIIGFCGIDPRTYPVYYTIHDGINDSTSFSIHTEKSINAGFLQAGDVLVLDNARIHNGGENDCLEDWLYSFHGIYVLWLPTYSPEFNPIELVWRHLVSKLQYYPLDILQSIDDHAPAVAASQVLSAVDHDLVCRLYHKTRIPL